MGHPNPHDLGVLFLSAFGAPIRHLKQEGGPKSPNPLNPRKRSGKIQGLGSRVQG